MTFGDLTQRAGLQNLNNYLATRSYIEGYEPSQADNVVFEALKTAPPGDLFNALRFFNHLNSFSEAERKAFPGTRKALAAYGEGGAAAAPAAPAAAKPAANDDDIDLFGSDDEEDAEAARLKEERVKAYQAKKSTSNYSSSISIKSLIHI
jgi:elongation factor 1-beta